MGFDIAMSGIQAINEQLGTLSNNIANAGTFGFKSSRANFASQYAGDQASGTKIGSVSQSIGTMGNTTQTGRGMDASINGRGFFVVKDGLGAPQYTRVGIFDSDANGFLVDQSGRRVQGFAQAPGSTVLGPLGDLTVPAGQIPAVVSTKLTYTSNFSADWKAPNADGAHAFVPPDVLTDPLNPTTPDPSTYNMSRVSTVYDAQGNQHSITQYFIKTANNTINVSFAIDGQGDASQDKVLTFDGKGALIPTTAGQPETATLTVSPTNGATTPLTLTVDYTGSTQFAGEATTSVNKADGYGAGNFTGTEISKDGSLIAKYSNGQRQTVGKIALATFPSESSLTPISDTSWSANLASGTPLYTTPGVGMAGALTTSALEQSNVDVTTELVGLMTAQRNYQANSKVLQTESTVLQSLMQAM
ncbi:flagellar hook protein FlgE [Pseudoduganella ginsengisoli]|uniref:Flagellar hook protein FlgE n=1 Tax=Pseudoduganella ginsengisoli TaxID=1462440 RepID=A0A6L6Q9B5_9BURK|nr:flagellar hook-basal body complex protein [Pseudoduganella ginsengisoli]MTW06069.1 flagellar hook-basal body complex protein [Pseudoduganella ginsengisoli]